MGFEPQGPGLEFPIQLFDPLFELSAPNLQGEVTEPQIEKLPVGKAIKPKSHQKYCRIFGCDISYTFAYFPQNFVLCLDFDRSRTGVRLYREQGRRTTSAGSSCRRNKRFGKAHAGGSHLCR